jgi:protein involved in polysaccharide export with SLBB domain
MTLASLIDLAGGLLPNSEKFAIIAASDSPEGQDVDRVPVESGATRLIRDKDLVTVPIDSSILADPIQVVIQGAVKNPGTYFFTRKDQRFTDLVKQAGGLRAEAWVDGIQFARRPDLLKTNAQVTQQPRLLEVLNIVQTNEYKRAVAKAETDRLVFLAGAGGGNSAFSIPTLGGSGVTSAATAAGALTPLTTDGAGNLVTPARQGSDLFNLIGGNMDLRATSAFKNPNSTENVVLKPGDVVTVPELPSTVLVDGPGAVLPRAFVFQPGQSLRDYIVKAGGVTSDADTDRIIILRPTGSITRPSPGTRIELGDVIYIPTRVMISPLGSRGDVFDRTVKSITSAALIYGIFRSLVK